MVLVYLIGILPCVMQPQILLPNIFYDIVGLINAVEGICPIPIRAQYTGAWVTVNLGFETGSGMEPLKISLD